MGQISIVVAMSNGEQHKVLMTGSELEHKIRSTGLVRISASPDKFVWLNPAHIISVSERDSDQEPMVKLDI